MPHIEINLENVIQTIIHPFIKLLASNTYVFAPGSMVVYGGDVGREIYFIIKGLVEVVIEDEDEDR